MAQTSLPHVAALRLRQFVIADLCAIAAGVFLCLGVCLWLLTSPWMLGLAAVVAADILALPYITRDASGRS